jgi:phospholipid/cholesterol/gamma-HCH transport system substrate-binding protein
VKEALRQPKFRYTNETVGLFVLITLLIFIAGLIYSGQVRKWFNPGETLKVVLPDEGLFGLTEGSTVEILGTKAGEVRDIVINPDQRRYARRSALPVMPTLKLPGVRGNRLIGNMPY